MHHLASGPGQLPARPVLHGLHGPRFHEDQCQVNETDKNDITCFREKDTKKGIIDEVLCSSLYPFSSF